MKDLIKCTQELTRAGDAFISQFGPLDFHLKAHELLLGAKLHEIYNFEELVKASFQSDFNPDQNYGGFQFSDLPITVSMGQHCFLDLYFWRRRPTVIHDHHFTGAFQCLEGTNVDLEFEFKTSKKIGLYHDLGSLELKQSRTLKAGDIAPIDLLDKFIHQNHHQAELTINACFRTPDIGETNLSNYLYSGLRFEKHPDVLNRVNRLMSFINMGAFDVKKLDLTLDDAINFLIRNNRSESQSKKFLEVKKYMGGLVEAEGLDIEMLIKQHELKMDELEDQYN